MTRVGKRFYSLECKSEPRAESCLQHENRKRVKTIGTKLIQVKHVSQSLQTPESIFHQHHHSLNGRRFSMMTLWSFVIISVWSFHLSTVVPSKHGSPTGLCLTTAINPRHGLMSIQLDSEKESNSSSRSSASITLLTFP